MSYCVNCGVELDKTAGECPLCRTAVHNSVRPVDTVSPKPYPSERGEVLPVSRREFALILTGMLVSAAAACGLLNLLLLYPDRAWSLYVIGACAMLWIIFVPALLATGLHGLFRIGLDGCAVALYVYLISIDMHGGDWYVGIALPLIIVAMVFALLLFLLLRKNRHSMLTGIILFIGSTGLYAMGVEWILDRYLRGVWSIGWSLGVFTVSIALMIPLIIVRRRPALREEAKRRFHV